MTTCQEKSQKKNKDKAKNDQEDVQGGKYSGTVNLPKTKFDQVCT